MSSVLRSMHSKPRHLVASRRGFWKDLVRASENMGRTCQIADFRAALSDSPDWNERKDWFAIVRSIQGSRHRCSRSIRYARPRSWSWPGIGFDGSSLALELRAIHPTTASFHVGRALPIAVPGGDLLRSAVGPERNVSYWRA